MKREVLDFLLSRRSRPAKLLTAPGPERAALAELLTAAARVPDHGKLEPWRFVVIAGAGKDAYVAAIRARAAEAGQDGDKGASAFEQAPTVVAVVSSPKPSDKIPAIEQTLSGGAVALGLVNAALAAGWGASWMTGWTAYDRPLLEGDARARARRDGDRLRLSRDVRHGPAGPASAGRGGADHLALTPVGLVADIGRGLAQVGDRRFLSVLLRVAGADRRRAGGGGLGLRRRGRVAAAGAGDPAVDRQRRLSRRPRLLGGDRQRAGPVGVPDGAGRGGGRRLLPRERRREGRGAALSRPCRRPGRSGSRRRSGTRCASSCW